MLTQAYVSHSLSPPKVGVLRRHLCLDLVLSCPAAPGAGTLTVPVQSWGHSQPILRMPVLWKQWSCSRCSPNKHQTPQHSRDREVTSPHAVQVIQVPLGWFWGGEGGWAGEVARGYWVEEGSCCQGTWRDPGGRLNFHISGKAPKCSLNPST